MDLRDRFWVWWFWAGEGQLRGVDGCGGMDSMDVSWPSLLLSWGARPWDGCVHVWGGRGTALTLAHQRVRQGGGQKRQPCLLQGYGLPGALAAALA